MTKLLGISGKKNAGKTTFSNYITGLHMVALGITDKFFINENGFIVVDSLYNHEIENPPVMISVDEVFASDTNCALAEMLRPYISVYGYAETLKKNVCADILGLDMSSFSTQEGKNRPTKYTWGQFNKFLSEPNDKNDEVMTNREVLQVVGTDLFRKISDDVWVEALFRRIDREAPGLAIINDVRFPNEVKAIQDRGGKVLRFTRTSEMDQHTSENILDGYTGFDCIINNQDLPIEQTAEQFVNFLKDVGLMPKL